MSTEVFMPALGMTQETGKLLEWLFTEGQSVKKGEPIMVVETDKATVELEAPASGTLVNIGAKPGDDVPVGKVIALILAAGETYTAASPSAPKPDPVLPIVQSTPLASASPAPSAKPKAIKPVSPLAARLAEENGVDLSQVESAGKRIQKEDVLAYLAQKQTNSSGRLLASPKARRLGREQNIDLQTLKGSGPDGAVLTKDVLNATAAIQPVVANPPSAASALPLSRMWQVMAQRLTESWQTIPHFYLEAEVNAAPLKAWRAKLLERSEEKITFTDLIVKLTAIALRQHPRINSSWINGTIQTNADINIGLAVAVEDGLLVPVIHHADELGIRALAVRRKALVSGAQANKLSLTDMSGGTFTISNLGMFNSVDNFSAIVNPPEAAILALGRIADKIVAVNGQPVVQPTMRMTLSCDHRVIDGARGAEFLQTLVTLIEDPLTALD